MGKKKINKKRREEDWLDEDWFEEEELPRKKKKKKREEDEHDDVDSYDDSSSTIASVFTSLLTILLVMCGSVAAAFFLSGIRINLNGDEVVEIPVYSEYVERGATANFDFIKDVTWSLTVSDNVDTEKVGEYEVVYEAEYHYWKAKKVRTVRVIDNRCPIIRLKGGRKVTWSTLDHKDPGFTATDNFDGDLTDQVKVETVEADDGNTATITYTVEDSSGNLGISVRHVFLKDVIAPTLELEGSLYFEIPYGGNFTEPGYKAYDDLDGDLTDKVQVSSVLPTQPGAQTILYTVSDSSGNTVTDSRTVVVGPKPVEKKKEDKKDSNKKESSKKKNDKKKNN